jgi:hypothetical protein
LTLTGKTSLAHAGSCYFYQPALVAGTGANAFGECRLKRASGNNQYLFHKFLSWNIFSNTLLLNRARRSASFQQALQLRSAMIFSAPTL